MTLLTLLVGPLVRLSLVHYAIEIFAKKLSTQTSSLPLPTCSQLMMTCVQSCSLWVLKRKLFNITKNLLFDQYFIMIGCWTSIWWYQIIFFFGHPLLYFKFAFAQLGQGRGGQGPLLVVPREVGDEVGDRRGTLRLRSRGSESDDERAIRRRRQWKKAQNIMLLSLFLLTRVNKTL